ncbi:MAG: putative toxin-antitoxin system toxin component, PIN family [Limisphaerales bacterium]
MRITLDSSVLVAAHISRAGVCAELLEDVLLGHELVLSEFILGELREKLSAKFGYADTTVRAVVSHLKKSGELVQPEEIPSEACRDGDDLKILGTATAGRCDLLVTVDKDLLTMATYREVAIVRPGEFWRRVRG